MESQRLQALEDDSRSAWVLTGGFCEGGDVGGGGGRAPYRCPQQPRYPFSEIPFFSGEDGVLGFTYDAKLEFFRKRF